MWVDLCWATGPKELEQELLSLYEDILVLLSLASPAHGVLALGLGCCSLVRGRVRAETPPTTCPRSSNLRT